MKKIRMQLFGQFVLSNGDKRLSEESLRSNRLTNLLSYVLVHRDQVIPLQKLADTILGVDTKNPENTIRNLMYRLRSEMKVLGDDKYICTLQGAYQWNPEIEVESDYEEFETMVGRLREMNFRLQPEDEGERRTLCQHIISAYQGNVTEKIASETWIMPKVMRCQAEYIKTVETLCGIYDRAGEWQAEEQLCRDAMNIDASDEELHCWLIRSLHHQGKIDQAIRQYEISKHMLYESYGTEDMEKLQQTFREVISGNQFHAIDLDNLMMDMQEQERPRETFFCDYQIFRMLYRIEARRANRLGISEQVMLLTLKQSSGETGIGEKDKTNSELLKEMEQLEKVVSSQLRTGDVATRLSATQILLLLPDCSYENSISVAKRLQRNFKKAIGKRQVELSYELGGISFGCNVLD